MSTNGVGIDPRQIENTYVMEDDVPDPSYIIGDSPGVSNSYHSSLHLANCSQPYVAERSRSIYARLGARIAFFGIDARTEVIIRYRN